MIMITLSTSLMVGVLWICIFPVNFMKAESICRYLSIIRSPLKDKKCIYILEFYHVKFLELSVHGKSFINSTSPLMVTKLFRVKFLHRDMIINTVVRYSTYIYQFHRRHDRLLACSQIPLTICPFQSGNRDHLRNTISMAFITLIYLFFTAMNFVSFCS